MNRATKADLFASVIGLSSKSWRIQVRLSQTLTSKTASKRSTPFIASAVTGIRTIMHRTTLSILAVAVTGCEKSVLAEDHTLYFVLMKIITYYPV